MSILQPLPPPGATPQAIAVFDLDGTLTYRDTFVPWLLGYVRARPARWWRLPALLLIGAAVVLGVRDRGRLKAWLLRTLAGGAAQADLADYSRAYAERVCADEIRAGALAAFRQHLATGDHVVVLSASVDAYVPLIANRLGAGEVICTGVRWHPDGSLDGRLATANRQGEEKAVVLRELRARHPGATFSAYGNTSGDLPHLRLVERPLLVNGSARARRQADALGIPTGDWP
jgi:phosphatidylglycerophosphatase C